MFETSSDDLPMFPYHDEGIDDLLFPGEQCPAGGVGGMSLAEALLPLVESPSPSLSPWMCSTRYKTELCSRYAETGFCKYAERCQFAHGLHDLHVHSRHPKYKTELCRSFHTAGYCIYGTRCLFAHTAKEQRPHRRRRNIPCRTYRSFGVCPFGTRCNFLHIEGDCGGGLSDSGLESPDSAAEKAPIARPQLQSQDWKPRGALCRTFSSFGFCLYGTRCCFQHGLPSSVQGAPAPLPSSVQGAPAPFRAASRGAPAPFRCPSLGHVLLSSLLLILLAPIWPTFPIWPEDSSPLTTPLNEPMAPNAFTFSSQLNDVLLPLALRLQQLENSQAMDAACTMQGVWGTSFSH